MLYSFKKRTHFLLKHPLQASSQQKFSRNKNLLCLVSDTSTLVRKVACLKWKLFNLKWKWDFCIWSVLYRPGIVATTVPRASTSEDVLPSASQLAVYGCSRVRKHDGSVGSSGQRQLWWICNAQLWPDPEQKFFAALHRGVCLLLLDTHLNTFALRNFVRPPERPSFSHMFSQRDTSLSGRFSTESHFRTTKQFSVTYLLSCFSERFSSPGEVAHICFDRLQRPFPYRTRTAIAAFDNLLELNWITNCSPGFKSVLPCDRFLTSRFSGAKQYALQTCRNNSRNFWALRRKSPEQPFPSFFGNAVHFQGFIK